MPRIVTVRYLAAVAVVSFGASFQFYNDTCLNTLQPTVKPWIARMWHKRGLHLSEGALTFLWSVLSSCVAVGALISIFVQSYAAETIGRRNSLVAGGWLASFGFVLLLSAKRLELPELLFLGRIFIGMDVGLSCGIAPMFLTEISPIPLRGAAGTANMICIALGDFSSSLFGVPQLLGTDELWPVAVCIPGVFAITLCVTLPCLPKSPRYLLKAREHAVARRALQKLVVNRQVNDSMNEIVREAAFARMHSMDSSRHPEQTGTCGGTLDLFRRKYLRLPLAIAILAMFGQFTGSVAVFYYSTDIFLNANLSPNAARWCTVLIGFAYFLFVFPAAYLIERLGRRPLLLCQYTGCLVCMIVLSFAFQIQHSNPFLLWPKYLCVLTLVAYMCVYGLGASIPWLIASELFAQRYRSPAVFVSTFTSFATTLVCALAYLPFQSYVGIQLSFLPFIIGLVFTMILMFLILPETRNRSIEEIVREFRRRARTVTFTSYYDAEEENADILHLLGEKISEEDKEELDRDSGNSYGSIDGQNSVDTTPSVKTT